MVAWMSKNGRSDWIRTSDPYSPRVVRYRTALRSDCPAIARGTHKAKHQSAERAACRARQVTRHEKRSLS